MRLLVNLPVTRRLAQRFGRCIPLGQGGGIPAKAMTINGVPVTINGNYITIGAAS